jgi:hypothetical protein
MIGNGFDIALGIQSSYVDFYNWYCGKPSNSLQIANFKDHIQADISRDVPDDEKTWADFELGLGEYTSKFTKSTVDNYIDCYADAQEKIAEYLKIQENLFSPDDYTDESFSAFRRSMWEFYEEVSDREKELIQRDIDITPNENREISIISFNYTDSLERLVEKMPNEVLSSWKFGSSTYAYKLNRTIIHAHGMTTDFPVLGVNDDSQISNKELLETPQFREIVIKPECVTELGKLWHNQAETQISNSRFVCVLGMSLGGSDAKWWRKLIQWLNANDKHHLIIYWYEKNPPNGVSITRQLRCIDKVKSTFFAYGDLTDAEINAMKQRVHVVINTEKFLQLTKKTVQDDVQAGEAEPMIGNE